MKKTIKIYNKDIKLLHLLGLKEWEANENEDAYIGEVFPNSKENDKSLSIKIYVTCLPAQFYKFIIKNEKENIFLEIETGSGSLTKYYPMALAVAEGNLRIRELYN